MRRVLAAGTLGPTLLVDAPDGQPPLVVKLITTAVGDDAVALADALGPLVATPLADPGVVEVIDVGIDPNGVYLVAPYLDAPTLESRLKGGRQSLAQVLEWLVGPARALVAAHQQHRLHGALHPRDVLLPRGRGALTGLDISPALEAVGLQAPVRVPFTAPERASGKAWDARADQYSLAMLALDALSGRRLIAGTIPAFDRWTLADTPGEDARLHDVFARALHPDPGQRFASVADWFEALTGAAEPSSALSRFTREGVIPPAPDVRRTPPPDDVPDARSLALFPEEEPSVDAAAASTATPSAVTSPAETPERAVSPTGEWLVASMPEDAPPLADTGPLPIQSVTSEDETIDASATSPSPHADDTEFALRDVDQSPFDDVVAGQATDDRLWPEPVLEDDAPRRQGVWVAVVLLIVALLGFGTWRSLTRPDTPADVRAGEVGDLSEEQPGTPSRVEEDTLQPSEDDLRPGAPPPAAAGRSDVAESAPAQPATPPSAAPSRSAPAQTPSAPVTPSAPETPLSLDRARVLIRSSPAGQVRVNGRARGQTPLVLRDLPFGSYVIVISREGYVDAVREIDVLPSQPVASIAVDLDRQPAGGAIGGDAPTAGAPPPAPGTSPPGGAGGAVSSAPSSSLPPAPRDGAVPAGSGSLHVVSRPADARLFIDGQAYGTAPAVVPGLRGGTHVVRVELPGYRAWERRVDVQPGQRVRVDATLVPESR